MVVHQGPLDIEAACSPVKGDLAGPQRFSIGGTPQQAVKKNIQYTTKIKQIFQISNPGSILNCKITSMKLH